MHRSLRFWRLLVESKLDNRNVCYIYKLGAGRCQNYAVVHFISCKLDHQNRLSNRKDRVGFLDNLMCVFVGVLKHSRYDFFCRAHFRAMTVSHVSELHVIMC